MTTAAKRQKLDRQKNSPEIEIEGPRSDIRQNPDLQDIIETVTHLMAKKLRDQSQITERIKICAESNEVLKHKFKKHNMGLVTSLNAARVIDFLFQQGVIGDEDLWRLQQQKSDSRQQCRDLLALLHTSKNPEAFVQLYLAMKKERHLDWLVDCIDKFTDSSVITLQQGSQQSSGYGSQEAPVASQEDTSVREFALSQLKAAFGPRAEFRDNQLETIEALVVKRGRRLIVQPAGWGKTFIFITAAQLLKQRTGKTSLIVVPLLALIRCEVKMADSYGAVVVHISSDGLKKSGDSNLDDKAQSRMLRSRLVEIKSNISEIDAVFTTPEQLAGRMGLFREKLFDDIGMLVVDESQCIHQDGYYFRPSFRHLGRVVSLQPEDPIVLAVSSSLSRKAEADVRNLLGIDSGEPAVRGALTLTNVTLEAVKVEKEEEKIIWLGGLISMIEGSGIVYCRAKQTAHKVARWLRHEGVEARAYHDGVIPTPDTEDAPCRSEEYRDRLETWLSEKKVKVLVSTTALGMGVDIPGLQFVIVYDPPASRQLLYQQLGRAGRNSTTEARGIIMYSDEYFRDTFRPKIVFEEDDIRSVLETLETSQSGMSVDELERSCNIPRCVIEKILNFLSASKYDCVRYVIREKKWHRIPDRKYDHVSMRRMSPDADCEASRNEVVRLCVKKNECLMRQLCVGLGGDDLADYRCNMCSVCTGKSVLPSVSVNWSLLSSDDLRLCHASELIIHKARIAPGAFKVYQFDSKFHKLRGFSTGSWKEKDWVNNVIAKSVMWNRSSSNDSLEIVIKAFHLYFKGQHRPQWCTYIPLSNGTRLKEFAQCLAQRLKIPFVEAVRLNKVMARKSVNKYMSEDEIAAVPQNAYHRCVNLDGGYMIQKENMPPGPVLLVDYKVRSRWTMQVVGELLRQAGSGTVIPLALVALADDYE